MGYNLLGKQPDAFTIVKAGPTKDEDEMRYAGIRIHLNLLPNGGYVADVKGAYPNLLLVRAV